MDRPSIFPMDPQFLHHLRRTPRDCIEVYDLVDWDATFKADSGHTFRARCSHLASANRISGQFDGRSRLDAGEDAWRIVYGSEPATHELHYDRQLGVWDILESQGQGDGRRTSVSLGWTTWGLGEKNKDLWIRCDSESVDQHSSLYHAGLDSRQFPRLHDWRRFHESLCICLCRREASASTISFSGGTDIVQEDGGGPRS